MKKLFALLLLIPTLVFAGQTNNPGGGASGSNTAILNLSTTTVGSISGVVSQYFNAAYELYLITQGMNVDPRYYGAICNTNYADNRYPNYGYVTTTAGSPVISISGYTFQNCLASPATLCDIGKVISINDGTSTSPVPTYILSVNTGANTATLGANMPNSTTTGQAVWGGYPPYPSSNPADGADDTNGIHNASTLSAIFHGGKVVLPTNCLVHNLVLSSGTKLEGNNGGNYYGYNNSRTATTLFVLANGYNSDSLTGININGANGIHLKDFTLFCNTFPYLGFQGIALAGVGMASTGGTAGSSEGVVLDHIGIAYCPVGLGFPYGHNQTVTFTGYISGTSLTVTAITSKNFLVSFAGFDWLNVGRAINTATFNGQITGTQLTVNSISFGAVGVGTNITGTGVGNGVFITALGTGTGGTGTYTLGQNFGSPINAETMNGYGSITSGPTAGGAGSYTLSSNQTIGSAGSPVTFTSGADIQGAIFGSSRFSEYVNNGIGMNGDFSDWSDVSSAFTGNFSFGAFLGPNTSSAGTTASRFIGTRFEEGGVGLGLGDGSFYNNFDGCQWQFNQGYSIETFNGWGRVNITGGLMQGGGVGNASGHQAYIGLNGTSATGSMHLSNVDFYQPNYVYGGNTQYIFDMLTTGADNPDIELNGGIFSNCCSSSIYNAAFGASMPSKYRQVGSGILNFDTSQNYTVATLPTGFKGAKVFVTDAVACAFQTTPTGGGAVFCPVIYNGTAWVAD